MKVEDDWAVHIRDELQRTTPSSDPFAQPSIFMVSSPLRGLKLRDFVPQVVAIGPYHCHVGPHHSVFPDTAESHRYKAMAAKDMERHKIMVANETAKRCQENDFFGIVNEFLQVTDRVKEQYDCDLDWESDENLSLLLALDAAFVVGILESLLETANARSSKLMYASWFPRPLIKSVLQDFILLENQIPLFLVTKIIRMDAKFRSDEEADQWLDAMIHEVACQVLPFSGMNIKGSFLHVSMSRCNHLLDCLYRLVTFQKSSPLKNSKLVERPTHSPRAVDLANAGVNFRAAHGAVMDVSFHSKSATLYLPKIRVGDDTEKLFRNLIAYESHLIDNVEVLSYLRFMNNLVDTPEDVALLLAKGILAQDIGSNEEVAQMFNNLCVNTMRVWSRHYEEVSMALNKHCNFRLNVLKAEFKAQYLARPWLVVSLASGAALMIMTFVTMYYTILLYRHGG